MNSKSAVVTNVAKFLMERVTAVSHAVPSDTVPAATSLAENEPDIATEMWVNSAPFIKSLSLWKVKTVGNVLSDGGAEHG